MASRSPNISIRLVRSVRTVAIAALLIASATGQEIAEYQVKAAFLYNFAKFVEWPPQAFRKTNDPITICVLGKSPILGPIEQTVTDKKIEGRPIAVFAIPDIQHSNSCQILFVSSSERKRLRSFAQEIRTIGILTVGESEGFAAEGGVINFKLENGRVRFEINMEAAEGNGLKISSKLLSLAQIVKGGATAK